VNTREIERGGELTRINVTSLSQYVHLRNCERYLRFRIDPQEEKKLRHRWGITVQPLTPLLREAGLEFEQRVENSIAAHGEPVISLRDQGVKTTIDWLVRVENPTVLLQATLEAPLGRYLCSGVADVIHLRRDQKGLLHIHIADIKSSRRETVEHRLQVVTYAYLLRHIAEQEGIGIGSIAGTILRAGENGEIPIFDPTQVGFDMAPYLSTLNHLMVEDDCVLDRVAGQQFEEVFYHLGYWCDGCMFNALCMYDSAERLDLSLVPALSAVEKRSLQAANIHTVPELAKLMELPAKGSRELTVSTTKADTFRALSNQWPLGPNLPILIQRAKRTLGRFDNTVQSHLTLYNSGFGTLPNEEEHPGLVKIFFDAQHDYLRDRVYLLSALVSGPRGEETVVTCTEGPPTKETERQALLEWIQGILAAVLAVASGSQTPLHLYCYNSYDQRVLLEALKRHLSEVALLPGFFDLVTQSPAVTQPIISFLAAELESRLNLGLVCAPLHDTARTLGFNWQDEQYNYFQLFRARMFDNRRNVSRVAGGHLVPTKADDPDRIIIETASRFNSQIPLEYAYAAWDRLPISEEEQNLLAPFRQVRLEHLTAFARRRVQALAYIEQAFKLKARFLNKPAIDLASLAAGAVPSPSLAQGLREFLFMEHYTAFQGKLQVYSLPIDRRVQTGLALLLRFESYDAFRQVYRFAIDFNSLGIDPVLTMNAFRLKEGAWCVLNPTEEQSANRIKNGRLAVIQLLGSDWIELKLLDITFNNSRFRYFHQVKQELQSGNLYTLDEMADDMNADKALEALGHANQNTFYQWLLERPEQCTVDENLKSQAAELLHQINAIEHPAQLTTAQSQVIGPDFLGEPAFLVQGPPGTGKSYTLGWAVLSRLLLRAMQGQSFHVAVVSKTHNAVNIVLESITKKWQKLAQAQQVPVLGLLGLPVYKIVNDPTDTVSAGVQPLYTYGLAPNNLEMLLSQPYLIVGGTSGGFHTAAKRRGDRGGRNVDWSNKTFDLLIIDEASQMSLPEAVLAGAFLREDGQIIVVGDHRQMPPIIAHNWEQEELRTAASAEPYLSLFESLLKRGFPRVALDESFRLHHTIARFLQDNIYVHDDIHFFSRRTDLISPISSTDPLVDLVLNPQYPIIVIEHGEQSSRQYNETELALIEPLIEACVNQLGLDGRDGLGIVVPHRAQRAMLQSRFPELAITDSIDTVERFQGGERDVIIVSATASDPSYVLAEADFLLNLNRLNVALSRPRKKLIVIASRSVTNLLVSELDTFENAAIWKRLYYQYADQLLWHGIWEGVPIWVRGHGDSQAVNDWEPQMPVADNQVVKVTFNTFRDFLLSHENKLWRVDDREFESLLSGEPTDVEGLMVAAELYANMDSSSWGDSWLYIFGYHDPYEIATQTNWDSVLEVGAAELYHYVHPSGGNDYLYFTAGLMNAQNGRTVTLLFPNELETILEEVATESAVADVPGVTSSPALTLEMLWQLVGFKPNEAQERAITHIEGPLYLPAGPGSGKTRVLLWRVLNLIVFHGVKPEEIFLSTFTEKAAHQLQEGLQVLLGIVTNRTGQPYDFTQIYVGTVHSLCQRILMDRRHFSANRQRVRPPRLLDDLGQYFHLYKRRVWNNLLANSDLPEEGSHTIINRILENKTSESKHNAVNNSRAFFNRLSEESVEPAYALQMLAVADPTIMTHLTQHGIDSDGLRYLFQLYQGYKGSLQASANGRLTDFALLQQAAYQTLTAYPEAGRVFKHVIIDEYQDTNTIQERIFFGLAAGYKNICVVGDDDQALYRFRGATVENFVQFVDRCRNNLGKEPTIIPLVTNYRSRKGIVDFYTQFIGRHDWQNATGGHFRVVNKEIVANNYDPHPAVFATTPSSPDNAYAEIAQLVRQLVDEGKVENPNQIAFLFPSLKSVSVGRMLDALEGVGLQVYAPRAGRFLEVDEAVDMFGLYTHIFSRPPQSDIPGRDYLAFRTWLDIAHSRAKDLIGADPQLASFVRDRREELSLAVSDYEALLQVIESQRWNLTQPYDINQMKRPLYNAFGLSERARKSIASSYFEKIVQRRIQEGNPLTLGYVISRATSIDWTVLDLFYRLCGFNHFKQMFDLAENGTDEGPICNLGLITQYLSRYIDQYLSLISAEMLHEGTFQRLFFSSYLFALFRLGESEYEDAEDPFPKGRIPFLTIHQSKGLEFPVVVLPSPRKDNRGPQRNEILVRPFLGRQEGEPLDRMAGFDAMRMFYVALSRAENLLIIADVQGRGQSTHSAIRAALNGTITRIPDFDLDTLPNTTLKENTIPRAYSFTGDFLNYRKCPRQYMIFERYGFVASRSQTMFFGTLVHQTLEDLHSYLIAKRSQS
jgi:DNA helicase II / ATP-dependent DNA helicase PcrA